VNIYTYIKYKIGSYRAIKGTIGTVQATADKAKSLCVSCDCMRQDSPCDRRGECDYKRLIVSLLSLVLSLVC
jgi:hypothetical protein